MHACSGILSNHESPLRWAPDYIDAMWRVLQHPDPADFVVATGESHSLQDFVAKVFECVGLDWRDHVLVDRAVFRPTDIEVSRADPTKAQMLLGWGPQVRFDDLIGRLVEAERSMR